MKYLNLFILLLLSCISLSCIQAQEESAWKDMLGNMSYQDIQAITFFDGNAMHNITLESRESLWNTCNNMIALDSPLCRCYPSVQGRLFFFLTDNTVVTVEIADHHWVQGIFIEEGRSVQFLLIDKENKLGEAVEKALKASEKKEVKKEEEKQLPSNTSETKPKEEAAEAPTTEEIEETEEQLCSDCQDKMFAMMIGSCSSCGEMTSSCAFKYCQSCARKKGVCQACGKSLK